MPHPDPEGLIHRARARCAKLHRVGQVTGLCRECLAEELEQTIAEEHLELKRGDVFELVQEWLRTDSESQH